MELFAISEMRSPGLGLSIFLSWELKRCRAEVRKLNEAAVKPQAKPQPKARIRPAVVTHAQHQLIGMTRVFIGNARGKSGLGVRAF